MVVVSEGIIIQQGEYLRARAGWLDAVYPEECTREVCFRKIMTRP